MKNFPAKPVISPSVLSQELDGETVLLDLEGESYFGLNHTGTRIWQLMKDELGVPEILDIMGDEFDAPREQLESDLGELLDRLSEAGIIRFT